MAPFTMSMLTCEYQNLVYKITIIFTFSYFNIQKKV